MRIVFLVLLLSALARGVKSEQTNELFLTDDRLLHLPYAEKLATARRSKESLPAAEFPEGNWGTVTNGFQLSLRFETNVLASGGCINAIVLLRNVTNSVLCYQVPSVAGRDGPIGFVVFRSGENIIKPLPSDEISVISSREVNLFPKTQHKYIERLDKRFDLKKPGQYTVFARFGVGRSARLEIRSAKTQIEVKD